MATLLKKLRRPDEVALSPIFGSPALDASMKAGGGTPLPAITTPSIRAPGSTPATLGPSVTDDPTVLQRVDKFLAPAGNAVGGIIAGTVDPIRRVVDPISRVIDNKIAQGGDVALSMGGKLFPYAEKGIRDTLNYVGGTSQPAAPMTALNVAPGSFPGQPAATPAATPATIAPTAGIGPADFDKQMAEYQERKANPAPAGDWVKPASALKPGEFSAFDPNQGKLIGGNAADYAAKLPGATNAPPAPGTILAATTGTRNFADVPLSDAAKNFRSRIFTGGGMGGPTFSTRPSKEERILGMQSKGALAIGAQNNAGTLALQQAKGASDERIAASNQTTNAAIRASDQANKLAVARETGLLRNEGVREAGTLRNEGTTAGDASIHKLNLETANADITAAETSIKNLKGVGKVMGVGPGLNESEQAELDTATALLKDAQQRKAALVNQGGGQASLGPQGSPGKAAPVKVSSQAEYDALPDGTPVVAPDGTRGIKGRKKAA